jgi:hypothetical protein
MSYLCCNGMASEYNLLTGLRRMGTHDATLPFDSYRHYTSILDPDLPPLSVSAISYHRQGQPFIYSQWSLRRQPVPEISPG